MLGVAVDARVGAYLAHARKRSVGGESWIASCSVGEMGTVEVSSAVGGKPVGEKKRCGLAGRHGVLSSIRAPGGAARRCQNISSFSRKAASKVDKFPASHVSRERGS